MPLDESLLTPSPIVKSLEESGEGSVRLSGYVGTTDAKNKLKLWQSLDMKTWVDVLKSDVIHAERSGDESRVTLWIKESASLTYSNTVGASFMAQVAFGGPASALQAIGPVSFARPDLRAACDTERLRCIGRVAPEIADIIRLGPDAPAGLVNYVNQEVDRCNEDHRRCMDNAIRTMLGLDQRYFYQGTGRPTTP